MLIALGLSKLNLNGMQGSVAVTVLGILGIWIIAARLILPLFDLSKSILVVLPQLIPSLHSHYPIDGSPLAAPWRLVAVPSTELSVRVQAWFMSVIQEKPVDDGLVRSMTWTLILWLIAAWIGWFAGKRNAIAALLPSILVVAAVTSYSERRIYTLWLLVSMLLLLMGIWNYKNHTTQWNRRKVDYSDSIRYDVTQSVIFLTVAIGIAAFFTPSISWREIRDFFREWNRPSQNQTAEILGVQQAPVTTKKVATQTPSLPRDHLLTEGYAQSEKIVMTIRTGELPPIVSTSITSNPPRHYWRSVTYDQYVGAGWVTSAAPAQKLQPNTPLIPGLLKGYQALHTDVTLYEPEGKLFWSGVLFSVDTPFTANWRLRPPSALFVDQSALLQADLFAARSNVKAYKGESYIPIVAVDQLRNAATNYPEEILNRYLQLPAELPDRVRQLANQLTVGKTNPYDKAKAIEAYLRTYPYDLNIPAPPTDRDVVDYFLFDLKKGYCDYYATAMVVLSRASGLPARFVSGYASGDYDAPDAQYVVREMHAHSWAEIYFPEIGWIEFEPTASQPLIDRPATPQQAAAVAEDKPDPIARDLLNRFRVMKAIDLLAPIAVVFLSLLLYFAVIEPWRYLRLEPVLAIEKIYRNLYRQGRSLAGKWTPAETAYEFEQKLIHCMEAIGKESIYPKFLLSAQQEVESLTRLYQATLFSKNHLQRHDVKKSFKIWKHLRIRLLIARATAYLTMRVKSFRALARILKHPGSKQPSIAR